MLECTLFRRVGGSGLPLASDLIKDAVAMLGNQRIRADLHLDTAGAIDGLLTGVGSSATSRGRSSAALPGACYRHAGWREIQKRKGKADVWLWLPIDWTDPDAPVCEADATALWQELYTVSEEK